MKPSAWWVNATRDDSGQIAIMTAIMMMALAGMLALVVDMGYAYGQRRMAQNVADSGAVAATKVVAQNIQGVPQTDAAVVAAIQDVAANSSGAFAGKYTGVYVDGNSAPIAGATVGGGTLPAAARGVRLLPKKSFPAFFASMLGFQSLTVGATAIATTAAVTAFDQSSPDFVPFVIWGGNPEHRCPDGVSYGCNLLGKTVVYRSNGYPDATGASTSGRWLGNSNDFKGFIRADTGFLNIGNWVSKGGNACGQEPVAMMAAHVASGVPVVMPLVDLENGNGANINLHVIGFVAVKLNGAGCPDTETGQVVASSVNYGALTSGGTPPAPGVPSIRSVRLVQ